MKLKPAITLGALVLGAAGSGAVAQPWPGPDAARIPVGSRDVDFALSEVCYAYLLNNASLAELGARPGYTVVKPANPANIGSVLTLKIGGSDMSVTVEQVGGYKDCIVSIGGGDTNALHAAAMNRLAQWPVAFRPSDFGRSAGPTRAETLCGVSNSAPYDRVKFIESPMTQPSRFTVTLTRDSAFWPLCPKRP